MKIPFVSQPIKGEMYMYHIWCSLMISVFPFVGIFGALCALGLGSSLLATGITLVGYIAVVGFIDRLVEYYHRRQ